MQQYIYDSYPNLAAAIILQSIKDYYKNERGQKIKRIEHQCVSATSYFNSPSFVRDSALAGLEMSGTDLMKRLDQKDISKEVGLALSC